MFQIYTHLNFAGTKHIIWIDFQGGFGKKWNSCLSKEQAITSALCGISSTLSCLRFCWPLSLWTSLSPLGCKVRYLNTRLISMYLVKKSTSINFSSAMMLTTRIIIFRRRGNALRLRLVVNIQIKTVHNE